MPREKQPFKRRGSNRSKFRLFVIATEGTTTEVHYFNELRASGLVNTSTIHLEVLQRKPTELTNSSPSNVLRQLDNFKTEYHLHKDDELWVVIDRDKQSWETGEIADVARQCLQKKYGFGLSNPAIEVWFLLHRKDVSEYAPEEYNALHTNKKTGERTAIERELVRLCGSYNKQQPNMEHYIPHTRTAIERAKALMKDENERWPDYLGTHIFKLVQRLMA